MREDGNTKRVYSALLEALSQLPIHPCICKPSLHSLLSQLRVNLHVMCLPRPLSQPSAVTVGSSTPHPSTITQSVAYTVPSSLVPSVYHIKTSCPSTPHFPPASHLTESYTPAPPSEDNEYKGFTKMCCQSRQAVPAYRSQRNSEEQGEQTKTEAIPHMISLF